MIKIIPFDKKATIITPEYDLVKMDIRASFIYEGQQYVVIKNCEEFNILGFEYSIMRADIVENMKGYDYYFKPLPDDLFEKIVRVWEEYQSEQSRTK